MPLKRCFSALLALALALCLCACEDVTGPFEGPTLFRFPIPENTPAEAPVPEEPIRIEAAPQEGVAPQAEYDLPEEVCAVPLDSTEIPLKLADYPESGIALYHVYDAAAPQSGLLVEWGDVSRQFDVTTLCPGGIAVHSALWDADGDGADELILIEHAGSGTGVSVDNLHIVERTESGLSLYSLRADALALQLREWVAARLTAQPPAFHINGRPFLLPDRTDISCFAFGNIVSFETAGEQIRLYMDIQFWPPEREFHGVSDYAVCLQADVVFSDGTFTLQNFTASERS